MTERESVAAQLYTNGASLKATAAEMELNHKTVRKLILDAGAEIRSTGRPPGAKNFGHERRGPQGASGYYEPKIEPRYSCGHKRLTKAPRCSECEHCACSPKRRRLERKYFGRWYCRCGKPIEEAL